MTLRPFPPPPATGRPGGRRGVLSHPAVDALVIALLATAFLLSIAAAMPWHMDEFLGYHMLACHWYPGNMANTFRGSCTRLGLAPFGDTLLPLRSYTYTGSLPGLLYLPVFALWPSPLSARLLGLIALAAQAALLARVFGVRPAVSFGLLLAFLSYSALHVFDLGPVCLQTTLVFAVYALSRRWSEAVREGGRASWRYPAAAGLLVFVGIWNKVAFLFLLPSLALLAVVAMRGARSPEPAVGRRRVARDALVGGVALAAPTAALLLARTADGEAYYRVVTGSPVLLEASLAYRHFVDRLLPFLLNPLRTSHLIVVDRRPATWLGVLTAALVVALLAYGLAAAWRRRDLAARRGGALVAAWLLSLAMVAASRLSHAAHHVQLGLAFLILAAYEVLPAVARHRTVRALLLAFVAAQGVLYYQFAELRHEHTTARASRDLPALNAELGDRFGRDHLIVCIDWGLYYFKSLYGPPEQAVVHHWRLVKSGQVERVAATARRMGRRLAFVGLDAGGGSDWGLLEASVPDLVSERLPYDGGRWRVAYQPAGGDRR
ncbi:MAG: hypothetical protein OES32_03305 [Acidobacteriota bacterium]|nr:hypothetical protein [Acidobacteriota bacterium]MDH3522590.1 hypothetical protein [Acidobacteriota bacterium]